MNTGRKVLVVAVAAFLLGSMVVAQQERKTATAEWGAEEGVWDWDTNVWELTGGCWLNIKARHTAHMTARAMTVRLNDDLSRVQMLTAAGPVKCELLTAKDANGRQRKIVASCSQKATYEEEQQLVEMIGDAQADVTTLPEGEVEALHLTGESISANLKTNKLSARKPTGSMTTAIDTEKGEQ